MPCAIRAQLLKEKPLPPPALYYKVYTPAVLKLLEAQAIRGALKLSLRRLSVMLLCGMSRCAGGDDAWRPCVLCAGVVAGRHRRRRWIWRGEQASCATTAPQIAAWDIKGIWSPENFSDGITSPSLQRSCSNERCFSHVFAVANSHYC